ncbi:MAG: hypothetical protein IKH14_06645 [Prevotella sp.]|nr:hypothetical protein [Prevotella sp.]
MAIKTNIFVLYFSHLIRFFVTLQKLQHINNIIMGDFFKNILKLGEEGSILEIIKEKLGGGTLGGVLEKFNLDSLDLGSLAKSVLSVIGLAGNAVTVEETDEVEEVTEEEE